MTDAQILEIAAATKVEDEPRFDRKLRWLVAFARNILSLAADHGGKQS
jgi:hypothetical protein